MRILYAVDAILFEDFLEVADRLICDFDEIFYVVVLMLLECVEKHIQDGCFISSRFLSIVLLFLLVFNL